MWIVKSMLTAGATRSKKISAGLQLDLTEIKTRVLFKEIQYVLQSIKLVLYLGRLHAHIVIML